jgi:hypothetical protein
VTVFSFPYREERSRAGRPIFRPSVTVELQDADGRWHPFRLYADAGADITLLREADCRTLGYELEAGEEQFMGGIGPGLIRTFVHQMSVRLGAVELLFRKRSGRCWEEPTRCQALANSRLIEQVCLA